jgi:hypothetical protein
MNTHFALAILPFVVGVYLPMCPPPEVRPTVPADQVDLAELWAPPAAIEDQDAFTGRGAATMRPIRQPLTGF